MIYKRQLLKTMLNKLTKLFNIFINGPDQEQAPASVKCLRSQAERRSVFFFFLKAKPHKDHDLHQNCMRTRIILKCSLLVEQGNYHRHNTTIVFDLDLL